jgi:rhomboid protease GluP
MRVQQKSDYQAGARQLTTNVTAPPRWYSAWLRTETSSLSWAIIAIWLLVFYAEQKFYIARGDGLQPNALTNIALGALDWRSVSLGEWWRFFTNPILHGGPNHLRWDIIALLGVGPTFQALVGRAWFGATFALVALISGVVSIITTPEFPGTVGPMGVVMGILAANFIVGFHFRDLASRIRVWQASGFALVISLLDTFRHFSYPVDIGGHLSGAAAGAAVGCALLWFWTGDRPRPAFRLAAQIITGLFVLGAASGLLIVTLKHSYYVQKFKELIPASDKRGTVLESVPMSENFLIRYPNDAWAHLLHGISFLERNDNADAEDEFRTGLRLADASPFQTPLIDHARAILSLTLSDEGRFEEAEQVAAPSCQSRNPDAYFRQLRQALYNKRICKE